MSMPVNWDNIVVVTNRSLSARPLPEQVERVCEHHPRAVVLREKDLSAKEYRALAEELREICAAAEVPLVLHSYADVAQDLGADALHLPLPALRELAGKQALAGLKRLGCSVHSPAEAREAECLGADYLFAGHVFSTQSKAGLAPRGIPFLADVCAATRLPVFAIGGIDLDKRRIAACLEAGAAGTCVMSAAMRL